ncbi:hypothetical protein F2P81_008223 [Scophthalmus maximus]|uniref:Uncharacterized protein n=1 Tax=Scophthalmus maximus TaxID=52904 RepID=A0A6A4T6N9_SCOMX|nr:hypothetical protein F2P81_008223 [Scophthalmus maximus]
MEALCTQHVEHVNLFISSSSNIKVVFIETDKRSSDSKRHRVSRFIILNGSDSSQRPVPTSVCPNETSGGLGIILKSTSDV